MAEAQILVWRNGSEPRWVCHEIASVLNPFEADAESTILSGIASRWLYRLTVPARRTGTQSNNLQRPDLVRYLITSVQFSLT
jgi:hypothetical protein